MQRLLRRRWIAALEAALAMEPSPGFGAWGSTPPLSSAISASGCSDRGATSSQLLWNGEFYKIDAESGTPVVMADQLCERFLALPGACRQW